MYTQVPLGIITLAMAVAFAYLTRKPTRGRHMRVSEVELLETGDGGFY